MVTQRVRPFSVVLYSNTLFSNRQRCNCSASFLSSVLLVSTSDLGMGVLVSRAVIILAVVLPAALWSSGISWCRSSVRLIAAALVSSSQLGPPSRSSIRRHCLQSEHLLNPSAFSCLFPGRCWSLKVYSARISSHRATWCAGSFLLYNHWSEAWSVLSTNSLPYRYGLKCFTASITPSNSRRVVQ